MKKHMKVKELIAAAHSTANDLQPEASTLLREVAIRLDVTFAALTESLEIRKVLLEAYGEARQRIKESEANQQKIESMSSYSDEKLKEIECHSDNSLLGHIPASLARELRQTRSRLGDYYDLLRRADSAEQKVLNLIVALRANGVPVDNQLKGDGNVRP